MNFIALGFALPAAFHNPWLHGFALLMLLLCLPRLLGIVYIPHTQVGVIEKIWSSKGSLREGQIIARNSEAGFQARFLRGGIHFGLYPWQYRIHKEALVSVAEGKMAYVYARDGVPLEPVQTLGRTVDSNHFQDAVRFLEAQGQRGRQRTILREGVYAINLALFVVITEERVFQAGAADKGEIQKLIDWQKELAAVRGFDPVVIGHTMRAADPIDPEKQVLVDTIGIVTIHDGPSLSPG